MSKEFYEKYYDQFLELKDVNPEDALTPEEVQYYISENFGHFDGGHKGDIVFVKRFIYSNGTIGENHLFVIIDEDSYIPFEYFGMIISSNIKKETYKYNIKINKDSIIKTDHIYKLKEEDILKKVGEFDIDLIDLFKKKYKEYKDEECK